MDAGHASGRGTADVECIIRNVSPADLVATAHMWDGARSLEHLGFELAPGKFAMLTGHHVTGRWSWAFTLQHSETDGRAFAIATTVTPSMAIPVVIPTRSPWGQRSTHVPRAVGLYVLVGESPPGQAEAWPCRRTVHPTCIVAASASPL